VLWIAGVGKRHGFQPPVARYGHFSWQLPIESGVICLPRIGWRRFIVIHGSVKLGGLRNPRLALRIGRRRNRVAQRKAAIR